MARLSHTLAVASFLFSAAVCSAQSLEIANTVQAGKSTKVQVTAGDSQDETGESYTGYRVYLAITPPGWDENSACYLVNWTDIDVTQVQVTIPASVVPDKTAVNLGMSLLTDDNSYGDTSSFSNNFTLEGGTGEWSALELNGYSVSDPEVTPCTALQCARDCGNTAYPDGNPPENVTTSDSTYDGFYNCIAACPGVNLPPLDEVSGGDGDDGDDGDDGTSTDATSSATGSAMATKATSSASSASATASATATSSASKTSAPAGSSTTTAAVSSAGRTPLTAAAIWVWCFGALLTLL